MTEKPQNAVGRRRKPPGRKGAKGRIAEQRRAEVVRLALCLTPVHAIATHLGLSIDRVSRILAEPETEAKLERARHTAFTDAIAELRQLTRRAVSVIAEELERRTHPAVRLRAAIEAISLAGAAAPKTLNVNASLENATDEQLKSELARIQIEELEEEGIEVPLWLRAKAEISVERRGGHLGLPSSTTRGE